MKYAIPTLVFSLTVAMIAIPGMAVGSYVLEPAGEDAIGPGTQTSPDVSTSGQRAFTDHGPAKTDASPPGEFTRSPSAAAPAAADVPAVFVETLVPDEAPHLTANVRTGDLLGDGSTQIFITEPLRGHVIWLRGRDDPVVFSEGLTQPVRTQVVDLDGDGHRDLLVADIGMIIPVNDKVGSVVLLRNNGSFQFQPMVLLQDVRRVACAEAADLDGDGDLDIAVCVFGHDDGKVVWLENKGGLSFEEHVLDPRPGAIHAFPFDADSDGDLDLAVALSQDDEEVLLCRNDGSGGFTLEVLFKSDLHYFGMSGIELADLDQDGDEDILLTNGDEGDGPLPEGVDPYEVHGLKWLENDGSGRFAVHEVVRHWGAYAARAADFDRDRDLDIVLSATQIEGRYPDAERLSVIWLENDGAQNFTRHKVLGAPQQLITIEVADINRDGVPDILGGSYNDCVFADPKCGPVGHRLVAFNIGVPGVFTARSPSVGDPAVSVLPRVAAWVGLTLLAAGLTLVGLGRRRGARM